MRTPTRSLKLTAILPVILLSLCSVFVISEVQKAHATAVVGFEAGNIIDNAVFTSSNSMSVTQIQSFLNSKVTTCDTYGTQTSEFGGGTRAQWAASRGYSAPFTCLKDYTENGLSSAQILYNAGQQYHINPQVLIVLLQKEEGLVTDTWPTSNQYKSATGYGCPDSTPGVCNSNYYGFTNQVNHSANMFNSIMTSNPNWYSPYVLGNNNILWNPSTSCGTNTVNIQNLATVALYDYTPYQPNQAALNAGYGNGDSCSSYGNRNFYLYFTDWFGSTKVYDPYGWSVVKTANDSALYLVVGNTKRWIPTGTIYNDWGLSIKSTDIVTQSYLDSIPTIPELGRLGYYNNNYYYVNNGKKYLLDNKDLIQAWGQTNNLPIASPAYVALSTVPDGGEATFYASLPSSGQVARLIDGQKYVINASDADRWQANPTALNADGFNSMSVAATVDYHISVNGVKYIVDNGKLLNVNSATLLRDYSQTSNTFVPMPASILAFLPATSIGSLVSVDGDNKWYVLRGGTRYYVPTSSHATSWGITGNPVSLSTHLTSGFPVATQSLPLIVKDATTGLTYLLDGTKHQITGSMADAAIVAGSTIPSFSSDYLSSLPTSSTISSPILLTPQGNIYTIDAGKIYYIPNGSVLNGIGYPRKYTLSSVSQDFIAASGNISLLNMFIKIGSTTYFLQDGNLFPIAAGSISDWTNGQSVPIFSSQNLTNRFDIQSAPVLDNFVSQSGNNYVISNGSALAVGGQSTDYLPAGKTWKSISIFGMNIATADSTIVQSSDPSDSRVFLLSQGNKQHILSGPILSALSLQNTQKTTTLSSNLLGLYAQINGGVDVSPVVYSGSQGFKILNDDGSFYGFSDSDTVTNFLSGNQVNNINTSDYAKYSRYVGSITRLIKDPSGKVYWIEAGKKRWVSNGTALQRYSSTPMTSVSWSIANWLPEGSGIN